MNAKVSALLTCHNRRNQTTACLRALHGQEAERVAVHAFVVDAASSDGTPEAIIREFPGVTLIPGAADLYWNRGMRVAFTAALDRGFDYYLWLNDDTILDPTALKTLLAVAVHAGEMAIVVGSARDPESGLLTYGGVSRPAPRFRPLRFELVEPADRPRECETMNGNCVLVPHPVVERLGMLDPVFSHGMGDFDYGLRAREAGIPVIMAPGTLGTCPRNPPHEPATIRREWGHLRSVKGLPPAEWMRFCRRWAGPAWPFYAASPYLRRLLSVAMSPRT